MFYGIIIRMFYFDNRKHSLAHLHAEYQDNKIVISIPDAEILEGKFPPNKLKLVLAWIEIHKDELLADWNLAVNGEELYKIEGLK